MSQRALTPVPEALLAALIAGRPVAEAARIRRAVEAAGAARPGETSAGGESLVDHALAVAAILAELKLDADTLVAALLRHTVNDPTADLTPIGQQFGLPVAALIDGVIKMDAIEDLGSADGHRERAQAESLRKMLLAMAEDVRVVLIKLADRLQHLRALPPVPTDAQQRLARETMEIYAPLANRLGVWQLKWELEDLAFRVLEPAAYQQISALLAERRVDREQYLLRFSDRLRAALGEHRIDADISGRPKHIYGIWRKMQRKAKDFEQITDVRAVRVLVQSVRDCYAALGVVHGQWPYIPGEFDDYIATPKENHYRSLHTAVIGPDGKTVEVQIRTHEMHQQSEWGVAAHWRYKEGARADQSFDKRIAWLRTLLQWKDEVAQASEFVDQFKSEIFSERVYVFTPKGRIIDLPAGSTPLDFAYAVHTDIGHRCRGAKVNGHIVPLTYTLKTGERVEVLTVKEGGPSRDWLNAPLGYLHTSKARAKVQHWFKQQHHDTAVAEGRVVLERELNRLGAHDVNYERLAQRFRISKVDEFLAALGHGDIKPAQVVNAVQEWIEPRLRPASPPSSLPAATRPPKAEAISIQGVGNLLTRLARCCSPLPGDAIVGFVTRGHGITVHRRDCGNALRHHGENEERLIEVSWGDAAGATFPVEVEVGAYERAGLLRDITSLFANERINVIAVNTLTDKSTQIARMRFTLEISDLNVLSRVLAAIDRVPNVFEARRRAS